MVAAAGFSPGFRRHFLGTHFFNPPRYLHLMEMIPGADTDLDVVNFVTEYADRRLGKGVVPCKDTPNFIANRIGSFFGSTVTKTMIEGDYTIEEVDALTGPLIGLPNSASFRLLDIVGLDIWAFVGRNLYEAVPHDPWRERFLPTDFQKQMLERKWLGEKTGLAQNPKGPAGSFAEGQGLGFNYFKKAKMADKSPAALEYFLQPETLLKISKSVEGRFVPVYRDHTKTDFWQTSKFAEMRKIAENGRIREWPSTPQAWLPDVTDARYTLSDMMSKICKDGVSIEDAQAAAQTDMMDSYTKNLPKKP